MHIVIRRAGTLIDVSPDGRSPLPREVADLLTPHMYYTYKRILRGAEAYDLTGEAHAVDLEERAMFRFEQGRLTTGYGFIPKIVRVLQAHGHTPHLLDISPPRRRPDCYTPDWDNMFRYFTPRADEQVKCLQAIAQTQGGIIDATMGFGKTYMLEALCHLYPLAKFAIVVEPKDVAAKIVRRLTGSIANIGQHGGGVNRRGDRVTVFTAGSMQHSDDDFDFLLCDEVHQLMSPKHSQKLGEYFTTTRNYGFSGSPNGRLDGAGAKLEMFFGPTIFRLGYEDAVALGLVVPLHVRWLLCNLSENPAHNKSGVPRMRWGVWRNDARNAMFAHDVRTHYTGDEQILMAVATIDHAIHLWRHLPEFELCYSNIEEDNFDRYISSGMIPQSFQRMTADRRDSMRTAFEQGTLKRVIATDVWSTGVDFEQLQVLYRLDARESEILDSQWPGRTSRLYEGKEFGEVVDSVDAFDKTLKNKSLTRRRHYKAHGWSEDWPRGRRQVSNV